VINLNQIISAMHSRVNKAISPHCEMYRYARTGFASEEDTQDYYFSSGFELAKNLCGFLLEVGVEPEHVDLLDFAAGYGRITRWLVPTFKSVTVADVEQNMLAFHEQVLGIQGFLSPAKAKSLYSHPDRYDVVFVFSLFTHLPKHTWSQWLAAIFSLVRESGYLIFSTHSYEMFAELAPGKFESQHKKNFVFWEGNETNGRLQTSIYGSNVLTDEFVKRELTRLGNASHVRRYKKGEFDRFHDIYVARKIAKSRTNNSLVNVLTYPASLWRRLKGQRQH